jgi:NADPH:quinone reductase-like Zn-dependent oxidoreductase
VVASVDARRPDVAWLPRMRAVQFSEFGVPHEVAAPVDLPDPPAPGPDEVAIDLLCAPINPADLLLIAGEYGRRPPLPAIGGLEGVGRIAALGRDVHHLRAGDRVLIGDGTWRARQVRPAAGLLALPPGADDEQLAMLTVNPPTAAGLLKEFVELAPGDWYIQNAANSGVGLWLIALAKRMDVRTLAVVRRPEAVDELLAAGAAKVLVDGPDLAERARAAVGGRLRLGIDAVGGEACARIAASLDDGGVVVNYGLLSGQPCQVGSRELVFREIRLAGYWLVHWFRDTPADEIGRTYAELAGLLADGTVRVPVLARYPLSRAREAIAHAARDARGGKILLTPDP